MANIPRQYRKNPFLIPDHYFENFNTRIAQLIDCTNQEPSQIIPNKVSKKKTFLNYASCAAACLSIFFSITHISSIKFSRNELASEKCITTEYNDYRLTNVDKAYDYMMLNDLKIYDYENN